MKTCPLRLLKPKRKDVNIASIIEFSLGLSDREVLDPANREDRILVTFDKDFGGLVVSSLEGSDRKKLKVLELKLNGGGLIPMPMFVIYPAEPEVLKQILDVFG